MFAFMEHRLSEIGQRVHANVVAKFRSLSRVEQIHACTFTALVTAAVLNFFATSWRPVFSMLLVVACHGFLVGFIVWAWQLTRELWFRRVSTVAYAMLHAIAFLVATTAARHQVSMAMGLPAQDFDLTVGFFSLLFYLPAWCLILSVGLTPALLLFLPVLLGSLLLKKNDKRIGSLFAHTAGACGVALYASQFFQWSTTERPLVHNAVRLVAAIADYQPAAKYPGVGAGSRVRLHENGVMSTVSIEANEVKVVVGRVGSESLPELSPTPRRAP